MSGVQTPFHRVQIVIAPTKRVALHVQHAGLVYALLAEAFGRAAARAPLLPDGVMLDAPNVGQTVIESGAAFGFGMTILDDDSSAASALLAMFVDGLAEVGRAKPTRPVVLGGNFAVAEVRDLVAGEEWLCGATLRSVPWSCIREESERVLAAGTITLRFTSPLRMMRPKPMRRRYRECFDAEFFDPALFVARTVRRLHELGQWPTPELPAPRDAAPIAIVENRLVWMDYAYGSTARDKILAGALGRVRLKSDRPEVALALAVGQYARVGQSTRFGQGAYRIEEAGDDPSACPRTQSLLDAAMASLDLDEAGAAHDLPAGVVRRAARTIIRRQYRPKAPFRVDIVQPDGRSRVLAIPHRLDRALQRALLESLAPAVDRLLEEASVAYRRGLGRESAARHVRRAFEEGFRFGLRADFRRFFDTIDHDRLRDRLEAYLADDALVDLLMTWVAIGSPAPGRGIPTGAPLSPLLANLFLDSFDEEVARDGGRLVRYADDFVILYRTRAEADGVFGLATRAAQALELALNETKTAHVDVGAFDFLGYRFERRERWVGEPTGAPRPIEELGWRQREPVAAAAVRHPLPGEVDAVGSDDRAFVIVGPGLSALSVDGDQLRCAYGDGRETRIGIGRVGELLVIGQPSISGPALRKLLEDDRQVVLTDDRGRTVVPLGRSRAIESPESITAQVDMARDPAWRLGLARLILSAKIGNYAVLAEATRPSGADEPLAATLRDHAARALRAESIESLRGIEGAAAARWYAALPSRLPDWCRFRTRVAPDADDPVNVLLNMAMTALHRQLVIAIRLAGLVPTIGIFHAARSGHATLGSDLQEPFRHLMERAVIDLLRELRPSDFVRDAGADPPLRIDGAALRKCLGRIHATFARACRAHGRGEACTYRTHVLLAARSLRRHLLDRSQVLEVFRHPEQPT